MNVDGTDIFTNYIWLFLIRITTTAMARHQNMARPKYVYITTIATGHGTKICRIIGI